jgi:hypothetical protein
MPSHLLDSGKNAMKAYIGMTTKRSQTRYLNKERMRTMTKLLTRIFTATAVAALAVALVANTHAQTWHQRSSRNPSDATAKVAASTKAHPCSIATIAGGWVFITDVLYTQAGTVDGIAIGTVNIGMDGSYVGTYNWSGTGGSFLGNDYIGTVTVNPDCTGTVSFHDVGSTYDVVQSIVIARDGQEIWGDFQNPADDVGIWRAKRIKER